VDYPKTLGFLTITLFVHPL